MLQTYLAFQLVYLQNRSPFLLIFPIYSVDCSCDFDGLTPVCVCAEGFKEAAEKFRMESGIEPSVDLDERIKIREMILKGQIQEAIALINHLHPELLDTKRYLYFHLQVRMPSVDCFGTSSCPNHKHLYVDVHCLHQNT
jgi:hypothetical protein